MAIQKLNVGPDQVHLCVECEGTRNDDAGIVDSIKAAVVWISSRHQKGP